MRTMVAVTVCAAALCGCCTPSGNGAPVVVESSLARLELPERPSQVFRVGVGVSENTYVALTPGQIAQAPDAARAEVRDDRPTDGNCDDDGGFENLFGSAELCLAKRVSFGVARRNGGPLLGKVRLHLAGRDRDRARSGNVSFALSAAWGSDQRDVVDQTPDGDYVTRTDRRERNLAAVFGVRLGHDVLLYGGPYYLKTDFDFEHRRPETPTQRGAGVIAARGGHLGLAFLVSRTTSWLVEYSRASVESAGHDDALDRWSGLVQMDF